MKKIEREMLEEVLVAGGCDKDSTTDDGGSGSILPPQ
jgi:hypothetical protein